MIDYILVINDRKIVATFDEDVNSHNLLVFFQFLRVMETLLCSSISCPGFHDTIKLRGVGKHEILKNFWML